MDDPIFIPIEQLEQVQDKPTAFSQVAADMRAGKDGHVRIDDARPGRTKVWACGFHDANRAGFALLVNEISLNLVFCFD